ncbi:MAG: hypothetical protein GY723_00580 [bacterium]|nr:hypothetical protein [bacterium]
MTTRHLLEASALMVLGLLVGADASEACSVCIDPSAASRDAFGMTAVVLSLLPMALVGGILFFLRRASRDR